MVVDAVFERVPAVVDRVQREITLARFIGKLAVDQGVRELRERVEALTAPGEPATSTAPPSGPTASDDTTAIDPTPPPERRAPEVTEPASVPGPDELALVDYDELPASNIVAKLASLEPAERAMIAEYERAGRNRRTVLGKIAQLGDDRATS